MKRSLHLIVAMLFCMALTNAYGGGPLSVNISNVTNATCTGINNGSAQAAGVGGTSPYSYSWSPSGGNSDVATNLAPGIYTVTVTDALSATATATVTIGQTNPVIIATDGMSDFMGYNISCFGGNNGFINTTASGGPGVFDSISFAYTGNEQLFIVPAGITSIRIKAWGAQGGANWVNNTNYGGYATGDLAVTPGETLFVYVGQQPNGITGGYNGGGNGEGAGQAGGGASDVRQGGNTLNDRKIVGSAGGGAGYWSNLHVAGGIGGGLTGGDGYREPDYASNPGGRGANQSSGGPDGTCVSFNNTAMAGSFGQGGSPSGCGCEGYGGGGGWYGGAGSGNCRGGGGGSSYIGGVTDSATVGGVNTGNGKVTILYAGAPTYDYTWSNSANTDDISALTAGTYVLNVTSNVGCTATDTFEITQPAQLSANLNMTNISCFGDNNGSITVMPTGGVSPYTYLWNPNGETTLGISSLTSGSYSVTITDQNGCTSSTSTTITSPDSMTITAAITNETLGNDGAINLTVTGGNAPYTFDWSNSATTEDLSGIPGGTYSVDVTDSNDCMQSLTVAVGSTLSIYENSIDGLTIYPNPSDNIFNLVMENSTSGNYDLLVTDMSGKTVLTNNGTYNGLPIQINASEWVNGNYILKLTMNNQHFVRKIMVR